MYNVASGFILIIGNFTTMNKFILVIAMVCCITQLCSRFNAIYGTKHHIDMLDSISTNFARENTIYRGVRLWSMFNIRNLQEAVAHTSLCMLGLFLCNRPF